MKELEDRIRRDGVIEDGETAPALSLVHSALGGPAASFWTKKRTGAETPVLKDGG